MYLTILTWKIWNQQHSDAQGKVERGIAWPDPSPAAALPSLPPLPEKRSVAFRIAQEPLVLTDTKGQHFFVISFSLI